MTFALIAHLGCAHPEAPSIRPQRRYRMDRALIVW